MILRVKTHKTCRNGSKTRKSSKSHKTGSNSQKTGQLAKKVKNITFSRVNQNVTATEWKIRNPNFFWLRDPPWALIYFVSQFPPESPTTLLWLRPCLTLTLSLTPESRLRPIIPLPILHSPCPWLPSPFPFPLSPAN
jgi:hypothetical protein